ncbi:hypothetical protein SPSYN_01375 [Sporotomaculum syntrophicum]|uniref:Uncharacterized protein n=1 Tax=Sporotomaculum syntrophicum TaxID=182264 RepID=A0A9D2WPV2_9FIRM|nr:hypothetical protein SPSYN_01375 [Sporotomaculum syntrophicum]
MTTTGKKHDKDFKLNNNDWRQGIEPAIIGV